MNKIFIFLWVICFSVIAAAQEKPPIPLPQPIQSPAPVPAQVQPAQQPSDASQPVNNNKPVRSGFTINLSLGVAYSRLMPDKGESKNYMGLGGLNLALGGFVNPDIAILFKIAGSNY